MSKLSELFAPKSKKTPENDDLKIELFMLHNKLKKYEQDFNIAENDDLIEALIYEQKALQSRLAFLLKQVRKKKLEVNFYEQEE